MAALKKLKGNLAADITLIFVAFAIYLVVAIFVGGVTLAKQTFFNLMWGLVIAFVIKIVFMIIGRTPAKKYIPFGQ